MSMTDPIADMLTRIRNAQLANHQSTSMPMSKIKKRIAEILRDEGYIAGVEVNGEGTRQSLEVTLKYLAGREPVIQHMRRMSRPGRRYYVKSDKIPRVRNGLGLAIVSTSKGLMSGREARKQGVGGEVICTIY